MAKKDNKDILVYFSNSEADTALRKRLKERCVFISESAFMKEAAKEKLDREELMKDAVVDSLTSEPDKKVHKEDVKEIDIDGFLENI